MKIYTPNSYSYIKVVEIPKVELKRMDMCLCKEPRQTLSDFYSQAKEKPDIIINGGFFSMADGTTCFNYLNEGEKVSEDLKYKWGMGIIDEKNLQYGCLVNRTDWRDFISGYPNLIDNGRKIKIDFAKEIDYNARRSVLAYNKETIFIIAVELPGMTFSQLQDFLLTLKVDYAINLDGGGSTKILHKGKSITSVAHNRPVDNVIAFYLNPDPSVFLYRVQLGAFSNKKNAQNLLLKIQELPDTINVGYKNAYIRYINGLYKVQVGAFSKKTNAERVVDDLKRLGHSSFITT